MSEILTQMFSLPVQIALGVMVIIIIMLYLLSIVWVNRDARMRQAPAIMWTIIAIIPVAGLIAYCLLRPSLCALDRDEQDMQLELLQRQLEGYKDCPHCGYPAKKDFVVCPRCHQQLRNRCTRCGRTLEPDWSMCPYCTQAVGSSTSKSRSSQSSQRSRQGKSTSSKRSGQRKQTSSAKSATNAQGQGAQKSSSRPSAPAKPSANASASSTAAKSMSAKK